jgi:hypothetical protein
VIDERIAIVTPSFARDFELCRQLNDSVMTYMPPQTKHYVIVDRRDRALFRALENDRTVVATVEDIIPRGYLKLSFSKKWWLSFAAMVPAKGWLVQQLVKLSVPEFAEERIIVNVDSDVRFVRPVDPALFIRDGKTRMYRGPDGIVDGMNHVKWHGNVCRLLDVAPDSVPMDDYVGNLISWDRQLVLGVRSRIEAVTGQSWHVAFTRARLISEYLSYGLYVDKVIGQAAAGVWVDERPLCHTYWGPGPLQHADVERFVSTLRDDDVAFSIAGYTGTERDVVERATALVEERVRLHSALLPC